MDYDQDYFPAQGAVDGSRTAAFREHDCWTLSVFCRPDPIWIKEPLGCGLTDKGSYKPGRINLEN